MFVQVMLMFVDVMNFGQVQKIRFVVVKIVVVMNFGQVQKIRFVVVKNFRSNSNQFLVVILIRSSELASAIFLNLKIS